MLNTLRRRAALLAGATLLAASALLPAQARDRDDDSRWIGTWSASPQTVDPPFVAPNPAQFDNQTIRHVVRTSLGGQRLRVRFTNEFGKVPLVIGAATVARWAGGANIVPGSDRALRFGGRAGITLAPGAPGLSDAVEFDLPPLADLVISLHLPRSTAASTFHSLGVATTYVSTPGDYTGAVVMPVGASVLSSHFVSGVNVLGSARNAAIVAVGDSITDGFASTPNANRRWPNLLAQRLQAQRSLRHIAVLNQGISGNRTLFDTIGPNAQARFDRDALNAPGARWVILLEGINNLGIPGLLGRVDEVASADDIIAGHQQMIARARERGLLIYGATLTPYEGTTIPGYYSAEGEVKRQAVNRWIRSSGAFDAVIDFDKAIRDPAHPTRMLPAYDSGDHLHPNDAGYQAMANAIDLRLFRRGGDDD